MLSPGLLCSLLHPSLIFVGREWSWWWSSSSTCSLLLGESEILSGDDGAIIECEWWSWQRWCWLDWYKSLSSPGAAELGASPRCFNFSIKFKCSRSLKLALELDFVGFVGCAIGLNFTLSFAASFTRLRNPSRDDTITMIRGGWRRCATLKVHLRPKQPIWTMATDLWLIHF